MIPPRRLALLLLPLVAACQPAARPPSGPAPVGSPQAARQTECRATADRVFAAQNRAELSQRDERDMPFSGSYNSGIVTRGLSQRYQLDNMVDDCMNAGAAAPAVDTGTGPTFQPGANRATGPSTQ